MKTTLKIGACVLTLFAFYSCSTDELETQEALSTKIYRDVSFDESAMMMRESDSSATVKDSVSKDGEYVPPIVKPTK